MAKLCKQFSPVFFKKVIPQAKFWNTEKECENEKWALGEAAQSDLSHSVYFFSHAQSMNSCFAHDEKVH